MPEYLSPNPLSRRPIRHLRVHQKIREMPSGDSAIGCPPSEARRFSRPQGELSSPGLPALPPLGLAIPAANVHHQINMLKSPHLRNLLVLLALATSARAGIVDDVRAALAQNNFTTADSYLNSYRAQHGVTPEYIEAYSWMGRAALSSGQYDQAAAYARQTEGSGARTTETAATRRRAAPAARAGSRHRSAGADPGGSRPTCPSCRSSGDGTAHLWQHFDSRPPAEEPEPALVCRQARARASRRAISWLETAGPGSTQGLARAAFFLGALVWRLQSRSADHHPTCGRSLPPKD